MVAVFSNGLHCFMFVSRLVMVCFFFVFYRFSWFYILPASIEFLRTLMKLCVCADVLAVYAAKLAKIDLRWRLLFCTMMRRSGEVKNVWCITVKDS